MFFFKKKKSFKNYNEEAIKNLQIDMEFLLCERKGHKYEYLIQYHNSRVYVKKCYLCGYNERMQKKDFIKEKRIKARQDFIDALKDISYI